MSVIGPSFRHGSVLLSVHLLAWPAMSQETADRPVVAPKVSADRVSVDLVVRDMKGRPVLDLRSNEVEIYEDGVRQNVVDFRLVVREGATANRSVGRGSSTADGSSREALTTSVEGEDGLEAGAPDAAKPSLVALVFDRLGPAARSLAHQTAAAYVAKGHPGKLSVGLFSIDQTLTTLQMFTDDAEALRVAVDRVLSLDPTSFTGLAERQRVRELSDRQAQFARTEEGAGEAHVAAAEFAGAPARQGHGSILSGDAELPLLLLKSRMLTALDALERDQQGFATTNALLALVSGLQTTPGRKAIVLFSEGLQIPPAVEASFQSVISAANRANVAIYCADAAGLRVASSADEARREIQLLRNRPDGAIEDVTSGPGGETIRLPSNRPNETTGGARTKVLERNEDALQFAPESGLGKLAAQTAGSLIQGTNDLLPGLREVDEDLGTYYLLSYAPKNEVYDGRFRKITVKVKRPHGRLQARQGYLAIKTALPVPALDHEGPALAHLESGALPTTISLRLRGLQFPEQPRLSTVPILIEVPSGDFEFATDSKAQAWRQDFTILAVVRDASRRMVTKLSQRYALTGPLDRLEEARRRAVLFYREAQLPAGAYTVEAIAHDARSGAAGGARVALELPLTAEGRLRASSLVVVQSAEPLDEPSKADPRPLHYGAIQIYPNLGEPVARQSGKPLAFFLSAWPSAGGALAASAVEILRGQGESVMRMEMPVPAPDANGRVQLAGSVPIGTLETGAYWLRVTLDDGVGRATRAASFTLAP
jgi:VWFA-related protein